MDKDKVILAAVIRSIGEQFEGGWRVYVTNKVINSIGPKDGIHFLGGDRYEQEPGEWIVFLPDDCVMRIPGDSLHATHMIGDRTLLHLQGDVNVRDGEVKRDVKSDPIPEKESGEEDPILSRSE